jgi:hypothetical protein
MLTVFWDSQGVLLANFQKHGENVNSSSYCEVLLKLQDAIHRKRPGQLAQSLVVALLISKCQLNHVHGVQWLLSMMSQF